MLLNVCRSKLRVEDLREMQQVNKEASWASDKDATHCKLCTKPFSVARRKVRDYRVFLKIEYFVETVTDRYYG